MPTLQEVKTSRDTLLVEMQQLALGKFDGESRQKFDAMNATVTDLDGDITRLEATAKYEAEQRSAPKPTRGPVGQALEGDPDVKEEKREKEKRAFSRYITHGETRDITTGTTGANGAALVPQAFEGVLHDALKYWGPVSTLVGQKRTSGGQPMKISLSNDTGNTLTVLGESTAMSEVDPAFTSFVLSTDTVVSGMVKISIQELQDSYFDLDSWLRTKMGQRWGKGIEQQITNGNGSNVASLLSGTTTVTAIGNGTAAGGTGGSGATASNSIGYEDIVNLYSSLDPSYVANASWMFSSAVRGYLLGVKTTFGQPLFIPNPNGDAFSQLLGRPVVLNQAMPFSIATTNKTMYFGDLSQAYLLRTDGDLSILRLSERFADELSVGFLGYSRIGGAVTDAGTHPGLVLVQA